MAYDGSHWAPVGIISLTAGSVRSPQPPVKNTATTLGDISRDRRIQRKTVGARRCVRGNQECPSRFPWRPRMPEGAAGFPTENRQRL